MANQRGETAQNQAQDFAIVISIEFASQPEGRINNWRARAVKLFLDLENSGEMGRFFLMELLSLSCQLLVLLFF